jgi:hypothetical protein
MNHIKINIKKRPKGTEGLDERNKEGKEIFRGGGVWRGQDVKMTSNPHPGSEGLELHLLRGRSSSGVG